MKCMQVSIRQHTSAYVSIRQYTSAYVSMRQHASAYVSIRQHTSVYVSIRQHTSAYVSIPLKFLNGIMFFPLSNVTLYLVERKPSAYVSIRQQAPQFTCFASTKVQILTQKGSGTSISTASGIGRRYRGAEEYVSIRHRTSAYVSIRQHTSAYVSIRKHTASGSGQRCRGAEVRHM
jgi:hypothetical protein